MHRKNAERSNGNEPRQKPRDKPKLLESKK